MSAYVCSYETISVLAKAIVDYRIDFKTEDYKLPIITKQALYQSIGQALLQANVASVNYRYSEREDSPAFKYLDIIESKYDEGMILSCINEYSYQTSELPNWLNSPLKYTLDKLKDAMLERLIEDKNLEIQWR